MKIVVRSLMLAALVLFALPFSAPATEFANGKFYSAGTNPSAIVVADFNGDGKPDIAVVNTASNNVSMLLGNGDGTFQAAKNFDAGGSFPTIVAADFNADGKLDLGLFHPGDGNSIVGAVSILFGNGDGTFQSPKVTSLSISSVSMAAGDFNGDKKCDLILSNADPTTGNITIEILAGSGDGTFRAAQTVVGGVGSASVLVADFNNDGKLDLAVVNGPGVQALLGKGDGTFQTSGTASVADGFSVNSIVIGDINNDGKMDLIVDSRMSQSCGSTCENTTQHVSVFFGQGNGSFGSEILFYIGAAHHQLFGSTSTLINDLVVGDFNGDGKADVGDQAGSFEIRLSNGDGTFTPAIGFQNSGLDALAADLNGDKLADVVIPELLNNGVLVLINDSPTSGADLGIVSSGTSGGNFGVGMNFSYSADVLNEGPQDATNVVFTDTLPAGVTFVSATSTIGTCTQSKGVVTCDVGLLANRFDVRITIEATPTATGSITNQMSVSATQADLAPANNSASQTDNVLPVFTLTVSKLGTGSGTVSAQGGISCGNTCSAQYTSGKHVIVAQNADANSTFEGWGGACSGNVACAVTMTGDMIVTATFTRNPMLTVNFAGGGTGTVAAADGSLTCSSTQPNCSASYGPGTSVSLQASPTGGSTFTGWSGACSGKDPAQCSVTLNADATVTATFTLPPDFKFNPASTSLTLQRGHQATDVLSISEQGGFTSAIQLSCSVTGPSPTPACMLSPSSIPAGANSPSSTLTLDASALAAARVARPPGPAGFLAALLSFGLLGCVMAGRFEKRTRQQIAALLLFAMMLLSAACGGGGGTAQPQSQSYTVTVTGASPPVQHSTSISVIVQ